MRIAILTQYYPPEMGAPQARLSELADRFVRAGHEVRVITAMPNYPHGRRFDGYGGLLRREQIGRVTVLRTWIYPSNSMRMSRRLANYGSFVVSSALAGAVMLPPVDYLMTETPPLFLAASGWLLARTRRSQWILNVSDLWLESAVRLGVLNEGTAFRAARRFESYFTAKADLVTGQSREIVEAIARSHPTVPTYHLSNGVDVHRFRPDLRSDATRNRLHPSAPCVAVYAGLLGVAQGLGQLLEAAASLTSLPGLHLVLAGDGPDAEALRRRARELRLSNVTFLGPLARDEIPSLLASADIGLVPLGTLLPGAVPSKLYEAMASGLPVLAVADGEPAEIVARSKAGTAVRPGDVDALAAALRSLTLDPEYRRTLGSAGRQAAVQRFNRDRICEHFIGFLEARLTNGRPTRGNQR